jgi:hypothetical protein
VSASHPLDDHPWRALFRAPRAGVRRSSSWDRTGANQDFVRVEAHETQVLLDHDGPGCVTHLYLAVAGAEITDLRDGILRCYWDGETSPSVEVPVGDFFAVTNGRIREHRSHFVAVNPGMGAGPGLNTYFPMPFSTHARIELENRADQAFGGLLGALWFHVDYEVYDEPLPADVLRFHAQYRQERPTVPAVEPRDVTLHDAANLDGAENYIALDASGRGQMVGLVLGIDNHGGGWYGEGDDMVFVDGDVWPPRIHGTGHEEIFGAGACVLREYAGAYSGFHLIESSDFSGLVGMYRWFVPDPIRFDSSLRWTIEHGHANNFANDYCSVAYWYQSEPHADFPALPERDAMRPPLPSGFDEVRLQVIAAMARLAVPPPDFARMATFADPYYRGEFALALERIAELDATDG